MDSRNNFDIIRISLALVVLFFHSWALSQQESLKFLGTLFSADFAVKGFFTISGFLVMKSYIRSKSKKDYFEKRLRRIYPAYVAVIVIGLLIGSLVTSLTFLQFVSSEHTLKYLAANLLFLNFLEPTLPHVFGQNWIPAINGSLWTIKIEICLYFCVPIIYLMFKKIGAKKATLLIFSLSVAWVYLFKYMLVFKLSDELARQFVGQLSYFVIGAFLSYEIAYLKKLKYIVPVSGIIFFISIGTPLRLMIEPVFYASLVIFFATSAYKSINIGRYGDVAYGIYLYHFPLIQLAVFWGIYEYNAYLGMASTLLATLVLSVLSWHFIEKRFLKRSSHYIRSLDAKSAPEGLEVKARPAAHTVT